MTTSGSSADREVEELKQLLLDLYPAPVDVFEGAGALVDPPAG